MSHPFGCEDVEVSVWLVAKDGGGIIREDTEKIKDLWSSFTNTRTKTGTALVVNVFYHNTGPHFQSD